MKTNHQQFKDYITGKKVAFVGPSDSLVGKGNGSLIDSYDIVIRTNGGALVGAKYDDDYGKRCDILYVNQLFERKTRLRPSLFDHIDLSFLVLKGDRNATEYRFKNSKIRTRLALTDFIIMQRELGFSPLMGTFVINDILECNPAELYLTGFTLYKNGPEYIDGYLPKGANSDKLEKSRKVLHKPFLQDLIWKEKYKQGLIKADPVLEKILKS